MICYVYIYVFVVSVFHAALSDFVYCENAVCTYVNLFLYGVNKRIWNWNSANPYCRERELNSIAPHFVKFINILKEFQG